MAISTTVIEGVMDILPLLEAAHRSGKPLLVIAPKFSHEVTFAISHHEVQAKLENNEQPTCVLIHAPQLPGTHAIRALEEIEMFVNESWYDAPGFALGTVESAALSGESTILRGGGGAKELVEARVKELQLALGNQGPEEQGAILERLKILTGVERTAFQTAKPGKSCYVLELSVQPGGSRWAELHAYDQPAKLRNRLAEFCSNDGNDAAYHAISYGATLAIWTVCYDSVVEWVDLHPLIRAVPPSPEDGAEFCLDSVPEELSLEQHPSASDGLAWYESFSRYKLEFDWDAIKARLPRLKGPRLKPGETMPVNNPFAKEVDTYLTLGIDYGSVNEEL